MSLTTSSCKPYKIGENITLGRYLVATRDILPGESIIDEMPLVTGPVWGDPSAPNDIDEFCLVCCIKLNTNSIHNCVKCGLQLCSESCAKTPVHSSQECKVWQKLSKRNSLNIDYFPNKKELHNFILTIRCLNCHTQSETKVKWTQIESLQSKVDELEKTGAFSKEFSHLFSLLKWEDFDFEQTNSDGTSTIPYLAKHCLGAMITNAFSIFTSTFTRQGLYFLSSFMSHSCIMNTDRGIHLPSGRMVTKAGRFIRAGEPITTSYLATLAGTHERWRKARDGWKFTCRCDRCRNSEHELGTHLSTIKCPSCLRISLSPMVCTDGLMWSCEGEGESGCGFKVVQADWEDDDKNISAPWKVLEHVESAKPKDLQSLQEVDEWLEKYCDTKNDEDRIIHRDHSIFTQVKLHLCQYYGTCSLEDDRLKTKLDYCQDVLRVMDKLFGGGIYEMRGVLLFEMWSSLVEIQERKQRSLTRNATDDYDQGHFGDVDTSEATLARIRQEAIAILKYSFQDSHEESMLLIMQDYGNEED